MKLTSRIVWSEDERCWVLFVYTNKRTTWVAECVCKVSEAEARRYFEKEIRG